MSSAAAYQSLFYSKMEHKLSGLRGGVLLQPARSEAAIRLHRVNCLDVSGIEQPLSDADCC
jgi:hypothetical protein